MKNLNVLDNVVQLDGTLRPLGDMTPPTPEQEVEFRVNPEDPNKAQYKTKDGDEWQDFSSGGGEPTLLKNTGFPSEIPTSGNYNLSVDSGGYNILLVVAKHTSNSSETTVSVLFKNKPSWVQKQWVTAMDVSANYKDGRTVGTITDDYIQFTGSLNLGSPMWGLPVAIYGIK